MKSLYKGHQEPVGGGAVRRGVCLQARQDGKQPGDWGSTKRCWRPTWLVPDGGGTDIRHLAAPLP